MNQIIWNTADMESPNPLHNAAGTQLAIQYCEQLIADQQEPRTIADEVQSRIMQNPGRFPTITEVA